MRLRHVRLSLVALLAVAFTARAQGPRAGRPVIGPQVRPFVAVDTSVVALTHARVIDGTGAPARADMTLVLRDGRIESMAPTSAARIPAGALTIDLTGKSVIPGLVMMHEHLFYPTGPSVYANLEESFTRLYLAGGVTSMRTTGNMNGYGDFAVKRAIDRGEKAGPWIDATAPYLEGPGLGLPQVHELTGPDDARHFVDFWHDAGATSLKAYMHITRDELRAAVDEGHRLGIKLTGHLCSVTFKEAAEIGVDNLEHGFFVSTDFVADKKPDVCPGQAAGQAAVAAMDPNSDAVKAVIQTLIQHHVAITSTLTVFETFTPGRPVPPGIEVLAPEVREQFEQRYAQTQKSTRSVYSTLFPKARAMEMAFYRAGGLLMAGTDPTGGGGVVPGFADQRQLELLVESGLTPLEAIKVGTMNAATFLGRANEIGSIAAGKQADLVVIDGDPSAQIGDIRKVTMVFRQGVGYDPAKLIASVKGKVGFY